MATTPLVITSNRIGAISALGASVATVALDAVVGESFTLPAGFGDLLLESGTCEISSLSGAYVAPAPADAGFVVSIYSGTGSGLVDHCAIGNWTNEATGSGRPFLGLWFRYSIRMLVRQTESFNVSAPIIGGAGVTGTVTFRVRGLRVRVT